MAEKVWTVDELYRVVCDLGNQPATMAPRKVAEHLAARLNLKLAPELPSRPVLNNLGRFAPVEPHLQTMRIEDLLPELVRLRAMVDILREGGKA